MQRNSILLCNVVLCVAVFALNTFAQTSVFSYQGKIIDAGIPANGKYDLVFRLYDVDINGNQISPDLKINDVQVNDGVFKVELDFGSQPFKSVAANWLEIGFRLSGASTFTVQTPRDHIVSVPYAIQSASAASASNASAVGGVPASQIINSSDPRLTDARAPLANSMNYVQNTTSQQWGANFNISGDGTAFGKLSGGVVSAYSQFELRGERILSSPGISNLFAGQAAGGAISGYGSGSGNSFFGNASGQANTSGSYNSFFGSGAGNGTTTGSDNAFFGSSAGGFTTTGYRNAFFGQNAGTSNTSGAYNTIIGWNAGVGSASLVNATAIGSMATVSTSNSIVLGADYHPYTNSDTKVGIGMRAPAYKLHVIDRSNTGLRIQNNIAGGTVASFGGYGAFQIDSPGVVGGRLNIAENGNVGIGMSSGDKLAVNGTVSFTLLAGAGSTQLCRNALNQISTCSSSLRYKKNIDEYLPGLSLVNQLRPIAYQWKADEMKDVGFGAEDVAKIDPRFVTYNDKGEVEGVKYDRLSVAFVNAFKEQQLQIEKQQRQIDALKKLVCSKDPNAELCKEEK